MMGHRARKLYRELWGDGRSLFEPSYFSCLFEVIKAFSSAVPPCDMRKVVMENLIKDLPDTKDDLIFFQKIDLTTNAKQE
jgi:hypothetical protein